MQGLVRNAPPVERGLRARSRSARQSLFSHLLRIGFGCVLEGERAEARYDGRIVDGTREAATSLRFGSKFR